MPTPVFSSSDKVYLNSMDIYTTYPSAKLFHCYLEPYAIEKQVGSISYRLKLSLFIRRLYSVFHIIKLTAATEDPIP